MKLSSLIRTCAALAFSAITFASAHATPLITDWSFSVTAQFTGAGYKFGYGMECTRSTANMLVWGGCPYDDPKPGTQPANLAHSGLEMSGAGTGTITTDGGIADTGVSLTHYNSQILGDTASLIYAIAALYVELFPTEEGSGVSPVTTILPFEIRFHETPNVAPCVAASVVACDDIFVIIGSLNHEFSIDGNSYYLSLFPQATALGSLSEAVCKDAGATYPCIGFTTQEDTTNVMRFGVEITGTPIDPATIPEPGSLVLFSTVLGLMFAMNRRKRRN
jgi:hypothetical protein